MVRFVELYITGKLKAYFGKETSWEWAGERNKCAQAFAHNKKVQIKVNGLSDVVFITSVNTLILVERRDLV